MYTINCIVRIILHYYSSLDLQYRAAFSTVSINDERLTGSQNAYAIHIPVKKRWPRCCFTLSFFTLLFTVIRQKLVRPGGHGNECGYRSNVKYTAAIISRWVECPKTLKPHLHQWTRYPGWTQASEKLVKTAAWAYLRTWLRQTLLIYKFQLTCEAI